MVKKSEAPLDAPLPPPISDLLRFVMGEKRKQFHFTKLVPHVSHRYQVQHPSQESCSDRTLHQMQMES